MIGLHAMRHGTALPRHVFANEVYYEASAQLSAAQKISFEDGPLRKEWELFAGLVLATAMVVRTGRILEDGQQ